MNFALSEEQEMLQQMSKEFISRESSLRRVRELRDEEVGYSSAIWQKMAELGWLGLAIPAKYGGLGLGMVEMVVIMEEMGRGLMPEPMFSSVLMGGNALYFAGDETQKAQYLTALSEGTKTFTLAYLEQQSRYDLFDVKCQAQQGKDSGTWQLSGEKWMVPNATSADQWVVSARTHGARIGREGVALFLVDPKASGITVQEQPCMDNQKRFAITLNNTPAECLQCDAPDAALEKSIDYATVGLAAEMLGSMNQAFEMTIEYLKTRKQFGVPIGSFQALQHRAADQFVQTELARSAVYYAAMCLDEGLEDAQLAVSTAKARCNDAFHLIADESIQMHGGIGMTDEHDIGLFFKRSRVAEVICGDSHYHRERYARLKEY